MGPMRVVVEVLLSPSRYSKPKVIRSIRWAFLTTGVCLNFRPNIIDAFTPYWTKLLLFLIRQKSFLLGFAMKQLHKVVPIN